MGMHYLHNNECHLQTSKMSIASLISSFVPLIQIANFLKEYVCENSATYEGLYNKNCQEQERID